MVERNCIICSKTFETTHHSKICCSDICMSNNRKIISINWKLNNKDKVPKYWDINRDKINKQIRENRINNPLKYKVYDYMKQLQRDKTKQKEGQHNYYMKNKTHSNTMSQKWNQLNKRYKTLQQKIKRRTGVSMPMELLKENYNKIKNEYI
jgi:hypothetical protein